MLARRNLIVSKPLMSLLMALGLDATLGDLDFDGVNAVAGAITPVPGGVEPMTITMLLADTLQAARD